MSMLDVEMNVKAVIILVLLSTLYTFILRHVIVRVFLPSLRINWRHYFISLVVQILWVKNKKYLNICHFFSDFLHSIAIIHVSFHQYNVHQILFPKLFVIVLFRIVLLLDIFITMYTVKFYVFLFVERLQFWQDWGL